MKDLGHAIPCIVMGLETQIGLSILRELGRRGVRVVGVTHDARAIGLASRYLWRRVLVEAPRSAAMLDALRRLGAELGACPLITVSEANLLWLHANRDALAPLRPVLPPRDALGIALDKSSTLAVARSLGMAVPRSGEGVTADALLAGCADLSFPVVLKWRDPSAVSAALGRAGLPLLKAEYVHSAPALKAAIDRYLPVGCFPLVQEYCAGYGLGQFFYLHKGDVLRRFQHRRVAEWPPEGGFSCVCDALPLQAHVELQDKSIRLLQAIGWEGVAMVEYRFDPATGRAVLMEINGRFWGSYPLAMHSQAEFALLAYLLAAGRAAPDLPPPAQGVRCRMMLAETKRLLRIWLRPGLIPDPQFAIRPWPELARFVADFFRPGVRYYVWSLADPRPWLADFRNALASLWRRH